MLDERISSRKVTGNSFLIQNTFKSHVYARVGTSWRGIIWTDSDEFAWSIMHVLGSVGRESDACRDKFAGNNLHVSERGGRE